MAEACISLSHFSVDQFLCPVCLDLLKDPVTIHCGHSFCKVCINGCWDQEDEKGIYRCPQCRDTFTPRPVLGRNLMLAEVVEKLKRAEVHADSPAHCYAGPGDVECDFCTRRKHKAVKSCLTCLTSFCETHLKPHFQLPALKKHTSAATVQKISFSELKNREDFLKYFCYLTLDPHTANHYLHLSERNRGVRWSMRRLYSDHPERFDACSQVLCQESVCGRCYWEVEWSGVGGVSISVSYKEIRRKGSGKESWFGRNSQSWSLCRSSSSISFYHNDIETELRVPSSSRTGVYVDHSAGTLSFYSVSDTMRLIHRVHTTFTQPLYAGLWVYGGTVRFCDPNK